MDPYNKQVDLKSTDEIQDYYRDCGSELFEQGTEDYSTEASEIIKIQDKFYVVTVEVEMYGKWMDVGPKLYFIETITNISYKEIDKKILVANYNNNIINQIRSLNKKLTELDAKLIEEGEEI